MKRFAEGTKVPIDQTRLELMILVRERTGSEAQVFTRDGRPTVVFEYKRRMYLIDVPAIDPTDEAVTRTERGRPRTGEALKNAIEAEERRIWRALLLVVKAKFEMLRAVPVTFEQEFMPHLVLPNRLTVSEHFGPMIEEAVASSALPTSLMALPTRGSEMQNA